MKKAVAILIALAVTGSAFAGNFCFRTSERYYVRRTPVVQYERVHVVNINRCYSRPIVRVEYVRPVRHVHHYSIEVYYAN